MKRRWMVLGIIAVVITFASACGTVSTPGTGTNNPTQSTMTSTQPVEVARLDRAIVQIWVGDQLTSTGVVIGNGKQVLTVMNYEVSTPDKVTIAASDGNRYTASVGPIDSRTAVTLLTIEGASLPPATTGYSSAAAPGLAVQAIEWVAPYSNSTGKPQIRTTAFIVGLESSRGPMYLSIGWPSGTVPANPASVGQGAIITDLDGRVLGLALTDYNTLFPHPHIYGSPPGVAAIDTALDLLAPNASTRRYANSPLLIDIADPTGSGTVRSGYFPNYDMVSDVLISLTHRLGSPLPFDDTPSDYRHSILSGTGNMPTDGTAVTVAYPRPTELWDANGKYIGTATWIGIQYDRKSGKPDRLLFGDGLFALKGGYYMQNGTADLAKLIPALRSP